MDANQEIRERLERVEALRHDMRRINRERKALTAEKKDVSDQIEELLDEIKDVREGGGVQLSIAK